MEQLKKRDTKSVGDQSEAMVLAALVRRGYHVLIPFGENNRYDLVIEIEGSFFRIQVKTGRLRNGVIWFNCYSSHAHRKGVSCRRYIGEIDYFGVYCPDVQSVYMVPIEDARFRGCLRVDRPKNGQLKKMRWASDFLLERMAGQVGLNTPGGVTLPGLPDRPS
jgi:hypothetical protein